MQSILGAERTGYMWYPNLQYKKKIRVFTKYLKKLYSQKGPYSLMQSRMLCLKHMSWTK